MTDSDLKNDWLKNEADAALVKSKQVPPGYTSIDEAKERIDRARRSIRRDWEDQGKRKRAGVLTDRTRIDQVAKIIQDAFRLPFGIKVVLEEKPSVDRDQSDWPRHWIVTAICDGRTEGISIQSWNLAIDAVNATLRELDFIDWQSSRAFWTYPSDAVDDQIDEADEEDDEPLPSDEEIDALIAESIARGPSLRPMHLQEHEEISGGPLPSAEWFVDVEIWQGPDRGRVGNR